MREKISSVDSKKVLATEKSSETMVSNFPAKCSSSQDANGKHGVFYLDVLLEVRINA